MKTRHIHLKGRVQGVGFRPYVYHLAHAHGLKGWVSNTPNGVHLEVSGDNLTLDCFEKELLVSPPQQAQITGIKHWDVPFTDFNGFIIRKETLSVAPNLLISPDFALCEACRKELHDAGDRRFGYAFTTCTQCGPRYSIMHRLPYDREHTAMQDFSCCDDCGKEYHNVLDRRFYSQTNSCPQCAIPMRWCDSGGHIITTDAQACLGKAQQALVNGKIVAVKGIGGYLLMADARNEMTIKRLRERKMREHKPFALLYPNLEEIKKDAWVSKQEAALLNSPAAPIVLLRQKPDARNEIPFDLIAPGLSFLGVMLPYAPLLELIAYGAPSPLIATSANLSGDVICSQEDTELSKLLALADGILIHSRKIEMPQDDSVVKVNCNSNNIIIRRSRGYAPNLQPVHWNNSDAEILATGADLKSAFALQKDGNIYVSQYLGDLMHYEAQLHFEQAYRKLSRMLDFHPEVVVTDAHPGYISRYVGKKMAASRQIPVLAYQHHQAHFASVLAENHLLEADEPILGVIWDGTGYGLDGQVWGGEFFIFQHAEIHRVHHIPYFPHLLGDKMAKEPRLSALSLLSGITPEVERLRPYFTPQEWRLYGKLLQSRTPLQTSSMGRVFDGLASLLGICQINHYEGQAGILMENAALKWLESGNAMPETPPVHRIRDHMTHHILNWVVEQMTRGVEKECIAAGFHQILAHMIRQVVMDTKVKKVACSGGVFQNGVLVGCVEEVLNADIEIYFHRELPPGDEGIAYGQLAMHYIAEKRRSEQKIKPCALLYQEN